MLCITSIMIFLGIHDIKHHRRNSIFIIVLAGLVISLSLFEILGIYFEEIKNIPATTVMSFFGYVIRPLCIVVFIVLSKGEPKGLWRILFAVPLVVNFIIFIFAFIPGLKENVYYFALNDEGEVCFMGGLWRFSSHIVSGLYLIYFIYVSITRLKAKHISNAIIILVCSSLIVACVLVETFLNPGGDVHLLNTAIAVCLMFYYLFLYIESAKYDPLTGLFNRATYYQDFVKMERSATGLIQFDMNGLKYFNDVFGHEEGDKALITIAEVIKQRCNKHMYAYRLGGDEFIVIVDGPNEEAVNKIINEMKEDLANTKYSCSIGYAYRQNKGMTLDELTKEAEKNMYIAKEEFYKTSKIERRKASLNASSLD